MDYELNMDRLYQLHDDVKASDSVQTSTVDFWLTSFLKWRNSSMPNMMSSMTPLELLKLQALGRGGGLGNGTLDPNIPVVIASHNETLQSVDMSKYGTFALSITLVCQNTVYVSFKFVLRVSFFYELVLYFLDLFLQGIYI